MEKYGYKDCIGKITKPLAVIYLILKNNKTFSNNAELREIILETCLLLISRDTAFKNWLHFLSGKFEAQLTHWLPCRNFPLSF